jgi:hypothetical protein
MQLSHEEWRRQILRQFIIDNNHYRALSKTQIFENFGSHVDDITTLALSSLLKDKLLFHIVANDLFYINEEKLTEIKDEIYSQTNDVSQTIQPYDKNFNNLVYQFDTGTDKNKPNRGKYIHCTRENDPTFWITVVMTKGSFKSRRLVLGSMNDSKSRLSLILSSIERITQNSKNKVFIKKNIEDDEPQACGNSRQYSSAALDILQHLNIILEVSFKGNSKVYRMVKHKTVLTLDEIFAKVKLEQEQKQTSTIKQGSYFSNKQ